MVWGMHEPTSIMVGKHYFGGCMKPLLYHVVSLSIESYRYLIEKADGEVSSKIRFLLNISASSKVPLLAYGENTTKSTLVEAVALSV